jgi:hypothetical protein
LKNFFNNISPIKLTTLEKNKENGKAVERYMASLLSIALNARVSFTSRTEDDAKIDLVTLFSHPWLDNVVETIPTQVKSGSSFCSIKNDKLVLIKNKFTGLLNRNSWTLVCWTKVENEQGYWFLIKPHAKFIKLEYNSNHIINPLTKFQLIRIMFSLGTKNGGKGLIFNRKNNRQDYQRHEYIQLRQAAKSKYYSLKNFEIINPVFGKIEFTRIGWRHITRQSRWSYFKTASFEVMKIVDNLLAVSPSEHYTLRHLTKEENGIIYIENEFLLNYSNCKVFDKEYNNNQDVEVFVKILEISGYRKDWKNSADNNNKVFRRIIFKSIYYKQSSQNMHA